MKIGLSAESTIDLLKDDLDYLGIETVHFHVHVGETREGFDHEFTNEKLFEHTLTTGELCHTSAPNIDEIKKHFEKQLKRYDQIIHFTISSGLSSGYQNAVAAANGDPRIHVFDSHGTSGGIAVQAFYAKELIDAGYSFEEVLEKLYARRKFLVCGFQLERLDFLYKGGRCTKLQMFGANLLSLRPEILCDENGKFAIGKKFRGKPAKCTLAYIDDMLSRDNIDYKVCFLNYSTIAPETLAEAKKKCSEAGFKRIIATQACPTNSYHAGPGVLGLQFYAGGESVVIPKN